MTTQEIHQVSEQSMTKVLVLYTRVTDEPVAELGRHQTTPPGQRTAARHSPEAA